MPVDIIPIDEKVLKGSLYDYLGSIAKLQLTDARRIVSARAANEEDHSVFNIEIGTPLFVIEQVAYDQKGRAFEYSVSKFNSFHIKCDFKNCSFF